MAVSTYAQVLCLSLLLASGPEARSEELGFGPHDVKSAFHITKSSNRNEVHYGVRLDARCHPVSREPVLPYWKNVEADPAVEEPLSAWEEPGYGIAEQRVRTEGSRVLVELRLRGLRERPILIGIRETPSGCEAKAMTKVMGTPAIVDELHLVVRAFAEVESLAVRGHRLDTGARVEELITR